MPRARRGELPPVPVVEKDAFDTAGKDATATVSNVAGISGERLKAFIERIERVQSEQKALSDDIKEIKAEAKATGFDVKVMMYLIKRRKIDKDDLEEFESVAEVYARAIGMMP